MTWGLVISTAMAAEVFAAGALAFLLAGKAGRARWDLALRGTAGALIGSGITEPIRWLYFVRLVNLAGSGWEGLAIAQALVILVETAIYAVLLRGRWRLSLLLAMAANTASAGITFALLGLSAPP